MLINTANLSAVFTSFSMQFQKGFAGVDPAWQKIATLIPSSTEQNLYAFLDQFPQLREWLGDRQVKNLKSNDYTLINKHYEATVGVDRNKYEDDTFGAFGSIIESMGDSAARHPDELVFAIAALGASTLGYDGQFWLDTDHPLITNGVAGTATNYDSAGGGNLWMLLDTSRPLKPLIFQKRTEYNFVSYTNPRDESVFRNREFQYGVDARVVAGVGLWQMAYGSLNTLNATNFDAYTTTMMARKSDQDNPLGIRPNLLVCGPSNRAAARSLIEQSTLASGESNPNFKEVEVLVTPYLT